MEKLFNKITKIAVYIIMALSVFFTVWTIMNGSALFTDEALADQILNPYFLLTLISLIIAAAAAILFPFGQMASNPKSAIRSGISVAILAVIFFISWSIASDSTAEAYYQKFNITGGQAKLIDSLIYVVYFLGALSILSVLVSGLYGLISKR